MTDSISLLKKQAKIRQRKFLGELLHLMSDNGINEIRLFGDQIRFDGMSWGFPINCDKGNTITLSKVCKDLEKAQEDAR